jgi:hypothetical protein
MVFSTKKTAICLDNNKKLVFLMSPSCYLKIHHVGDMRQPDMAFYFMPGVDHLPLASGGCTPYGYIPNLLFHALSGICRFYFIQFLQKISSKRPSPSVGMHTIINSPWFTREIVRFLIRHSPSSLDYIHRFLCRKRVCEVREFFLRGSGISFPKHTPLSYPDLNPGEAF